VTSDGLWVRKAAPIVGLVLSLKSFYPMSSAGRWILGLTDTNRRTKDDFPTAASPVDVRGVNIVQGKTIVRGAGVGRTQWRTEIKDKVSICRPAPSCHIPSRTSLTWTALRELSSAILLVSCDADVRVAPLVRYPCIECQSVCFKFECDTRTI
jgi:hypothetical protein